MIKRNAHTSNFLAHLVKLSACEWLNLNVNGEGVGGVYIEMGYVPTRIPKSALMRLGGPVVSFELRLILSRVGHRQRIHH